MINHPRTEQCFYGMNDFVFKLAFSIPMSLSAPIDHVIKIKCLLLSLQCSIEWFHFACVGLTTKPRGKWYETQTFKWMMPLVFSITVMTNSALLTICFAVLHLCYVGIVLDALKTERENRTPCGLGSDGC